MIGPGGPDHCSVMNCLGRAVVELLYEVAHPYQENRQIKYRFCEDHKERRFIPDKYPNYELIEVKNG